jgi:hypothetical protein
MSRPRCALVRFEECSTSLLRTCRLEARRYAEEGTENEGDRWRNLPIRSLKRESQS